MSDADIVRAFVVSFGNAYDRDASEALAALARLEAAEARLGIAEEQLEAASEECREWQDAARAWQDNYNAAVAQRDALAEALRTICNIGETRDVEVARSALADAGLIADSDTTTVFKS